MHKKIFLLLILLFLTIHSYPQRSNEFTKIIDIPTVDNFTKEYYQEFHFAFLDKIKNGSIRLFKDSLLLKIKEVDSLWYGNWIVEYNVKERKNDTFIGERFDGFAIETFIITPTCVKITLDERRGNYLFGYISRNDFEKIASNYPLIHWHTRSNIFFTFKKSRFISFLDSVKLVVINKLLLSDSSNFKNDGFDCGKYESCYSGPEGIYYEYGKAQSRKHKVIIKLEKIALAGVLHSSFHVVKLSQKIEVSTLKKYFTKNEIQFLDILFFSQL